MKKLSDWIRRFPFIFVLIISCLYAIYNWKTLDHNHLLFGDMIGKWNQVQDILNKPLGDHSCNYHEPIIDPGHKFIPLKEHFYFYKNKQCIHAYPYPYAYLAAPFVYFFHTHGFYILNIFFWLLYIYTGMRIIRFMIPDNIYIHIFTGLGMFYILPTAIYLYDASELILSMAIANLATLWFLESVNIKEHFVKNSKLLFASGFISGIAFVFRPENVIIYCGILLAYFLVFYINSSTKKGFDKITHPIFKILPAAYIGLILGFLLNVLYHYISFDTILPPRIGSPKSVPEQNLSNKIAIITTLLIGGNKGLFSSLPFSLLSFTIFIPSVFRKINYYGLFLFVIAVVPSFIVIAITPGDGGYSWSPRYLALMIAPFFYMAVLVLYTVYKVFPYKKLTGAISIILVLYSLYFSAAGVKILRASTKQGAKYDQIIQSLNDSKIIILQEDPLYVFLPEESYQTNRIFAVNSPTDFQLLLDKLSSDNPDFNSFIFGTAEMLGPEFTIPEGWKILKKETFYKISFSKIIKDSSIK